MGEGRRPAPPRSSMDAETEQPRFACLSLILLLGLLALAALAVENWSDLCDFFQPAAEAPATPHQRH